MNSQQDPNQTPEPRQQGSAIIYVVLTIIILSMASGVLFFKPKQPDKAPQAMPVSQVESITTVASLFPEVTVYKSETCGCCNKWITHLEKEGFKVKSYNRTNMNTIKEGVGLQPGLASCHTAMVDGYVIEGHVPAADIKQLLIDKPDVLGLTAPGMPKDSPGMQPVGDKPKGFDVLTFDKQGNTTVFKHY